MYHSDSKLSMCLGNAIILLREDLLKINKLKEKNVIIIIEREKYRYIYTEIREKQNTYIMY